MTNKKGRRSTALHNEIVLRNVKFLLLQDSACAPGAARILHDRYISYLEFRYGCTDNPCFVWDAIHLSYERAVNDRMIDVAGSVEKLEALSREDQVNLKVQAAIQVRGFNLQLPSWCISYLVTAASGIFLASDRLDLSTMAKDADQTSYKDLIAEWGARPSLTNEQATSRFAKIFEFTTRGQSAFQQRQSEKLDLNLEQLFRDKYQPGVSAGQIYAAISTVMNIDERALRRRIANGRRLIEELESFLVGRGG